MEGQIVKIVSDLYVVARKEERISCKCRGTFRKNKITPMVGDFVKIDEEKQLIMEVLPRKSELVRPPVSNIDQAIIVTSLSFPAFESNLLDKLIVMCELHHIKPIICLTKNDLLKKKEKKYYKKLFRFYKKLGYPVCYNTELFRIKRMLKGKTTVLTGQTGAGKSSLLNRLDAHLHLETNEISKALGRGKHTTRVVELIALHGGKVLDTPGFSALEFRDFTKEEIRDSFLEFKNYTCPYKDCAHLEEKECLVKEAVRKGDILESRYQNYQKIIKEMR